MVYYEYDPKRGRGTLTVTELIHRVVDVETDEGIVRFYTEERPDGYGRILDKELLTDNLTIYNHTPEGD